MGLDRPIDITTDQRKTVMALLASHLPNTTAWVYGSRVKWTSSPKSDLDLVVFATPEQTGQVSNLREAFEESNLPFRVDLFVWDDVPEQFRETIEMEHVVLLEREKQKTARDWHKTTLGGLLSFANGKSSPRRSGSLPHPVYGSNGIIGFSDESNADPNTIVVGRVGTNCGSLHYSDRMCWVTDNAIRSTAINRNDAKFVFYLLQTLRLNEWRAGSGQPLINQTILSSIPVSVPDPKEQRAISQVLGTLDDKIELNRRMNQTLEAMARVLFKSWFVDFDPVHAKATLKHHVATFPQGGSDWGVERARACLDRMDSNIATLFPDSFVDSELGPIPEGWEVVPLAETIEVNPSRPLRRGEIAPYLDMANMPTKGHTPETVIDRPFGSGMRFANGDTLLARITPCLENGKTAYVDFLEEDQVGWGSTEYIVLRPKPPLPSKFAYCLARSDGFREVAIQNMTGTSGRQRVPETAISNYRMTIPKGLGVPRMFGELVEPLLSLASQNADESHALAALRDTLLPKLISGELRGVKQAHQVQNEFRPSGFSQPITQRNE
ncbi:MAG: restriction endonuclease subunit S [Acidobacteriota bacterium]|nr:restriction endonuclease subunit S [Acidobacteriota bacterium]